MWHGVNRVWSLPALNFGYHYTSSPILILSKTTLQNTLRATLSTTISCHFLQRPRPLNEPGRRHNINEDFYIVVLRFFLVER